MKFTAVFFLVALAGVLVCAQDASSNSTVSPADTTSPSNADEQTETTGAPAKPALLPDPANIPAYFAALLTKKGLQAKETIQKTREAVAEYRKKFFEDFLKYLYKK